MFTKEYFLERIGERKARRAIEIGNITISSLRKRYQDKLESDEKMHEYFLEMGDSLLKYWNNFFIRPVFHFVYSSLGPFLFKKQFHLGGKPKAFIEAVMDYYMFISSYGAWPLEIDEVTEDRVVVYFDKCTVKCEDHLKLCLATTSMEPKLSEKPWFGAKITYVERIPNGDKRCKVVLERKQPVCK
jgi:hypothetical protein